MSELPTSTPERHGESAIRAEQLRWFATPPWRAIWLIASSSIILWATYSTFRLQSSSDLPTRRFRDFYEFFSGAEALVRKTDIFSAGDLGYIYPPLLATLLMPLVHLGIQTAALVWLLVNAALLGAVAWLGGRVVASWLGLTIAAAPLITFLALLILSDKIIGDMRMQQTNVLMLACWVLGLWAIPRAPIIGGLALGFAANIKYLTILALPYFVLRGRWKHALALVAGCAFWAMLPALFIGWERNQSIWRGAIGGLINASEPGAQGAGEARVMSTRDFGISITTAVVRAADAIGKPQLALVGVAASALGVFAVAWFLYWRNGQSMWKGRFGASEDGHHRLVLVEFVGLIVIAMAFSPQTNTRHLVQALPLGLLLSGAILAATQTSTRIFAIAGLLIWWLGMVLPPAGLGPDGLVRSWHRSGGVCVTMVIGWLFAAASVLRERVSTL